MVDIEDELLAVLLRGYRVGARRIGVDVAGAFLNRLHEAVNALAGALAGRPQGRRGPLPFVEGAGVLALAGLEWSHSAVFHFGIGPGAQFTISPSGDQHVLIVEAVETLAELVERSAAGEEEELLAITRQLTGRAATNVTNLLEMLARERVDTLWRVRRYDRPIDLSSVRSARAEAILEREAVPTIEERAVRGNLYRADSKEHDFRLDPDDPAEEEYRGRYPPELREAVREAYDRRVDALLRLTYRRLERHPDPIEVRVELVAPPRVLE